MSEEEKSIVRLLQDNLDRAAEFARKPDLAPGTLTMWSGVIRHQLAKIYGKDSPALSDFPMVKASDIPNGGVHAALAQRVSHLRRLLETLEALPNMTKTPLLGKKIFIGHGRSHLWLELKDFITSRLRLPCDEFNSHPAAGMSTVERLEAMLAHASFAFLVMTAEEKHADGSIQPRSNVIHEAGLFQARLGSRRAILMLEEGCSEFSNITGLTQIRFPRDDISARFEDVRRVLEREALI